jgi:acetyl esterase/lipase
MPDSIERRIRASLPFVRFLQNNLPLRLSSRLLGQSIGHVSLEKGVTRQSLSVEGIKCDWLIPEDEAPGRVLMYLHGGGFVYGQTPLHLQMGAALAKLMSVRLLMVDYSLAPAHPFPAALDECVAVYRWLLKQGYEARHIAIAGDSAGGNLTLTTMLKLRSAGLPLPAAGACLSPVTDLAKKEKKREGFSDPLLPPKAMKVYTEAYVGQNDARDPLISPIYGDLRGFPPLLIHVGDDEILREDAERITEAAKAAGVDVRLEIYPRMWHVWQLFLALPSAKQSLDDIAQFFSSQLNKE